MIKDSNTIISRNYLFDNLRALLIFGVVLSHVLTKKLGDIAILDTIYFFLFFFHMPAFVFISGYFSKNVNKSRDTAFQSFLIPYVVFNTAFWLKDRMLIGEKAGGFHILTTEWGMWFLLAIFFWKLFLKDLVKIRYIIPISIIVGLLSGFSSEFSTKMALGRMVAFLPFFLLGYFCNESHIALFKKVPKVISATTLVIFTVLAYISSKYEIIKKESLFMYKPYSKISEEVFQGVLIRAFIYLAATIITICFINLISSRKSWISIIGQNSVTVYIMHLFIVSYLRKLSFPWDGTIYYLVYAILVSLLITYLFSRPSIIHIYNFIINKITAVVFKSTEKNNTHT